MVCILSVMSIMVASIGLYFAMSAEPQPIPVKPSETDPAITQFNDPHLVYLSENSPKRNELVIFLPGTNGKPGGTNLFCQTAADLGYHVVALAYPTDVPATTVRNEKDPDAFEKFRLEIIEGRDLWEGIQVNRTNSIENRLIKALEYLARERQKENWKQFLESSGKLNWKKIVATGHSQGGGHAWLIGIKHRVARVVVTGAPKDFNRSSQTPAAWYRKPATPLSDFFAFNHELDRQGCNYDEQISNLKKFGLDSFGPPINVDRSTPPYHHSRMLFTNFEGSPVESVRAHVSVISDRATPKNSSGEPTFKPVWEYMLTESTTIAQKVVGF